MGQHRAPATIRARRGLGGVRRTPSRAGRSSDRPLGRGERPTRAFGPGAPGPKALPGHGWDRALAAGTVRRSWTSAQPGRHLAVWL